ncbi:glycosyltransferase [Patescibacteria group bacterium]|nr:glycosyltransferase [Patescibacteria group bacterium]
MKNILNKVLGYWKNEASIIDKVIHIANIPEIKQGKSTLKIELGLKGDIVLAITNSNKEKHCDVLIGIMPELIQANPGFKLIIVGSLDQEESIKAKIKELELGKSIFFSTNLDNVELYKLMKASDMLVLNDSLGFNQDRLRQAMKVGVPIIASNIDAYSKFITNDVNGLLVDIGDKNKLVMNIIKLWNNRMIANDFIVNAQEAISNS